jgi:hypothetical protein
VRQWVELVGSGDILIGRPDHELVKLIAIYAPGVNSGHLILRELKTSEGNQSFLLTAPDKIMNSTRRVTLYLSNAPPNIVLFEQIGNTWEKHLPQTLPLGFGNRLSTSSKKLTAFSAKKMGFYWFMESQYPNSFKISHIPQQTSAQSLMEGSIGWGLFPLVCSILILTAGWSLSRKIHRPIEISGQ